MGKGSWSVKALRPPEVEQAGGVADQGDKTLDGLCSRLIVASLSPASPFTWTLYIKLITTNFSSKLYEIFPPIKRGKRQTCLEMNARFDLFWVVRGYKLVRAATRETGVTLVVEKGGEP
jgi:hypothetical protein